MLLPTDYISRSYQNATGDKVSLYIGYHDGGPESGPIHSPKQCLPGSGWNRLNAEVHSVTVDGRPLSYVSSLYQKDVQQQLFLYWFQVRGDALTNEYALKFAMAKNSMLSNRRDSSFVRISVMVDRDQGQERARVVGEKFISAFCRRLWSLCRSSNGI